MSRKERFFLAFAGVLSIAMHIALVLSVLELPLGAAIGGTPLFSPPPPEPVVTVQIDRDARDLFIEEDALEEFLNPENLRAQAGDRVRDAAEELIEEVKPEAFTEPGESAAKVEALAGAVDPKVATETPDVEPAPSPAPGGPSNIDTTRHLLALAQPAITPPEFVSPQESAVTLPDGLPPGFGTTFDPSAIDAALGDGPGGTGTGLGPDGSVGSWTGKPGAPRAPKAPVVAKATRPAPVVPEVVPAPTPTDEKPTVHLDEDFDYRLLTYTEPPRRGGFFGNDDERPEHGYMEVRIEPRRSLRKLTALKKDVVWVVDTSASITSKWVEPVKRGVGMALDTLNPGDRFNLVLFNEQVSVLSPDGPLEATPENLTAARAFLTQAGSSGFTDVNRALGRLLVRTMPPDRVYQIVLLSDGKPTRGAIDPRSIINLITRENDLVASIFCVGIGDTLNRELLQYLAYRNKGFVVYPQTAWKASEEIAELAGRLRYPIVKDAAFSVLGVDGRAIYPRLPRDIYQTEPVSLFGRFRPEDDKLSMRVTGVSGADRLDFTFTLDFQNAQKGDDALMNNWAFWKLHHLYSEAIRQGETPQLKKQIDDLKREYKIKTTY